MRDPAHVPTWRGARPAHSCGGPSPGAAPETVGPRQVTGVNHPSPPLPGAEAERRRSEGKGPTPGASPEAVAQDRTPGSARARESHSAPKSKKESSLRGRRKRKEKGRRKKEGKKERREDQREKLAAAISRRLPGVAAGRGPVGDAVATAPPRNAEGEGGRSGEGFFGPDPSLTPPAPSASPLRPPP